VNGQEVNLLPFERSYAKGTNLTLEAKEKTGYRFSAWSGSIFSSEKMLSLTVNQDVNLTAKFVAVNPEQFTLKLSVSNPYLGQVRIRDQTDWDIKHERVFSKGTTVTIEAQTNITGVNFIGWAGNVPSGSTTTTSLTITMDMDRNITAEFLDKEKPKFTAFDVIPRNLNTSEGYVTITATVTDNVGVREVFAKVTKPNGETEKIPLQKQQNGIYQGDYGVRNDLPSQQSYKVIIIAEDFSGLTNQTPEITITLAANQTNTPPAPYFVVSPTGNPTQVKISISFKNEVLSQLKKFEGRILRFLVKILKSNDPSEQIQDTKEVTIPSNLNIKNKPKISFILPIKAGKNEIHISVSDEQGNQIEQKGIYVKKMTIDELYNLVWKHLGEEYKGSGLDDVMVAAAMCESDGNPDAVGDEGCSYGLWQINICDGLGTGHTSKDLMDPDYNAKLIAPHFKKYWERFKNKSPEDRATLTYMWAEKPEGFYPKNEIATLQSPKAQRFKKQWQKLLKKKNRDDTIEYEPNNSLDLANTILSIIKGMINSREDVDYFKFNVQEGERVSIWIIAQNDGSELDATLTLYDSDGNILAWNDDDEERQSLDPTIWHFTLPRAGTYYIKVESRDGSGSENHFYTLYLRREVANDDFGDDFETATPIERNQTIEGTIGHRGDVDVFRFNAYQDEFLTIDVRARRNGSPLDAVLTLYREKVDENGETVREIVGGWDDVNGYDPTVRRWKIPATGIYYLELKDFNGEGGADYRYTLNFKIEPPPMATIDTTPVTADVQMGEQRAQERKVGNIGGGSVGFASIGQQSGKSRRDLPNPFKGQRQIIFLSPRQASVEAEKATSPTRLRSPASVSQTMDKSAASPTPKEVPTHVVGQPITMPLPLGPKAGTRSAPSRQASQPPDANAWQWIIVDPTITTVENACNIHKVWMQRKDNMLYFKVETAGRTFDPTTVSLRFNLDTDMRAETGVRLFADMGVDYLVSIGEGTDGVWRWDSATESFNFVSDLTWQKIESNLVEIGFPLNAINDAEEFALLVELSDDDMLEQDSAPDEGFALITKLPPWLKVEPLAGTADSGEEVPMTITLNAEAVDQTGEISGTVQVFSTDPYKESQQIPVKITVTPPQLPFERGPGLFMVSLPISVDRQWHEILGIPEDQMKLAIYSPQENRYLLYNELAPEQRKPKPGVGVWIKLNNAVQTTVTGVPPKASEPFVINLQPGWQIIGVPWQVKWANLKVRKGNEELPISQAAERGWVYEILWTWDDEVGDYQMVWAGVSGLGFEEMLRPLMGYWILALEECQLVIPPKSEANRGVTVSRKRLAENGFVFGLMADDGRSKRRVWLGFSNEALGRGRNRQGVQAAMPPEAPEPSGIQVFALGANGKPLAADIRAGTPKKAEWDIVVRWNQNQGSRGLWSEGRQGGVEEVRLTWEGLGYLPKGMSATLVDMATNTRRYLRTQTIYTFKPASEEKERRFKVILEQGGTGLLRIVNLQANPVRGQGVMIQFALTKSATTQVEVLTLTGRRIAILEAGRSRQAGSHTILWRGTDGEGRRLPVGAYLLRVQAEDEEGRKVQATRTMILR
jgi:flagellar hook assembly protein FlgD